MSLFTVSVSVSTSISVTLIANSHMGAAPIFSIAISVTLTLIATLTVNGPLSGTDCTLAYLRGEEDFLSNKIQRLLGCFQQGIKAFVVEVLE